MLKPQKKFSKKELKEDKFITSAMQAKAYIEDNYRQVTTTVLVILAVVVAIMGYRYYHNQRVEKASILLGKAQLEYQNMNTPKAKQFLSRLIEAYDGTDAADKGKFLMANIQFQNDKIVEAKTYFEEFIDSYSGSKILISSAYGGLAACYEAEDNHSEAAETYIKAQRKAPDFVEAPNYLYLAGQNYLELDQREKARELFLEIQEEYPDSERSDDAKASLIMLAQK
ncbi:MAG: tetratricopeptide repeat protein [Caldithrix sp.]|nr:tetratricopeptide repeat protein [Caldithrix sp.]